MKKLIAIFCLLGSAATYAGPIENTTEQQIGRIQVDSGMSVYVTPKSPSAGWGASSCKNVIYAWFNVTGKNHWLSVLQMAFAMNRKVQFQVECGSDANYAVIKYISVME